MTRSDRLWLLRLEGDGAAPAPPVQLASTRSLKGGRFSPDGRSIAFTVLEGARSKVVVMDLASRSSREVFSTTGELGEPTWSTDGRYLALGRLRGAVYELCTLRATGGSLRQFPRAEMGWVPPAWLPDGRLLYQALDLHNWRMLDPVTEEERPLLPEDSAQWPLWLSPSPDGREVAVYWNRSSGPRRDVAIFAISLEDGSQTRVVSGGHLVGWSADGQWIYFGDVPEAVRQVRKVRRSGGEPLPVLTLPPDQVASAVYMSPDERSFTYTVTDSRSDVWLAEDFDPGAR